MEVKFIGTSHGVPEKDRYCSCSVVTVNGKHYVIDAGVSLMSALLHNNMEPQNVGAVFITHMHGDHISGLPEFVDLLRWYYRDLNPAIFVPSEQGKYALLNWVTSMDNGREVAVSAYSEGILFEDENVRVTAFRTQHTACSFGFLLEAEGKRVYFTGDMRGDLSDCPGVVYETETDLVVCESAHNCLPEIADKLNAMKTKHIVINHVNPKHSLKEFDECAPLMNKPFDMAHDGYEVIV